MDKNWINNYRLGSYTLFACGLINLRYLWAEPNVLARSAMIFVPGAIFLGATFIPVAVKLLSRREVKAVSAVVGILLIAYAFSN